jgi:hypothetical protein
VILADAASTALTQRGSRVDSAVGQLDGVKAVALLNLARARECRVRMCCDGVELGIVPLLVNVERAVVGPLGATEGERRRRTAYGFRKLVEPGNEETGLERLLTLKPHTATAPLGGDAGVTSLDLDGSLLVVGGDEVLLPCCLRIKELGVSVGVRGAGLEIEAAEEVGALVLGVELVAL